MAQNKDRKTAAKPEKKAPSKDLNRILGAWERLMKEQTEIAGRSRKSKTAGQISSVGIVRDENGNASVRVALVGGGKVMDAGDRRDAFQSMIPQKSINIGRIISLLNAVRLYGYDTVAAGLSPEMKAMLLKACERCGISLSGQPKTARVNVSVNLYGDKDAPVFSKDGGDGAKGRDAAWQMPWPEGAIATPSALKTAAQEQKMRNESYLKFVLNRAKERVKQEYFDRLVQQAGMIGQAQAKGEPLTAEQKNVLALVDALGLGAEQPTEKQMREREKFPLKKLPKDLHKKLHEEIERYETICKAKNMAADYVCHKHLHDLECGCGCCCSAEEFAREAAEHLPPAKERRGDNLRQALEDISERLAEKRAERKENRKARRQKLSQLMTKIMTAESPKQGLHMVLQQIKPSPARTGFAENAVVREMMARRQNQR